MNLRLLLLGLAGMAALCAAYFAGLNSRPGAVQARSRSRAVLYYVDPMHLSYRSDRPGKAPDCGMDLEPVYDGGESGAMTPGSVRLSVEQEQAVQLQTELVDSAPAAHAIHTGGRVLADESRSYRVSAGVDGWVRQVFSDRTGAQVKKGQVLAAIYSKDISAPQQAYLYALDSFHRAKQTLAAEQLATARDNLEFLGMGQQQIEELARTRREFSELHLTAPADGQVLERHVDVGQRFMKGELLYRIANLDSVWVAADVQSGDGVAARARIRIDGLPAMEARVASVPPQFDDRGWSGKLRLEVDNPHGVLTPGRIVSVDLEAPERPAITVHADAVIDSGARKRVFVSQGGGRYELREVETGWSDGDRVEIRSGLKPGEHVVTAGAFLLDSESRMKSTPTQVSDAECGMKVDRSAARRLEWKNATYYFCSDACERKFQARRRQ